MRHIVILALSLVATTGFTAEKEQNPWDPNYKVTERTARAIEEAAPDKPAVKPARPRKLLIYGRVPTHPMSVACCFKAIETLGKKTGAFETVASGDPLVFLPENLQQFDAVLMNNTHEQHPMLPLNFAKLSEQEKAAATQREAMLQKSLLDFVAGGKGIVGIHAAICGGWPEYLEMMGGSYAGHFTGQAWVKPDDPDHPLCAPLKRQSFQVDDEIYVSGARDFRKHLRVCLSLDLKKTPDPGKRKDGDYAISWVRPYDKGRVFFCSLGHEASSYHNPIVLQHYLAGIQFALGDLEADASPEQAAQRQAQVAERRKGVDVICHRGASEFAHENTLDRATFELGGDGNEIDIRATKDGVLVLFHDDMLDQGLEAFGDVSDYTWEQLQRFRFRDPGRFGEQCRIPTLVEVLDLHRTYGGLIHLDIKRPGLDKAIAELLTRMDMWDHVAYCNVENGGVILRDPRLKLLRYKAPGMYGDRSEVFPDAIAAALKRPGDGLIVDDPRGAAIALGRKLGKLSKEPVSPRWMAPRKEDAKQPGEAELLAILRDADDWDHVAETAADQAASGARIRARAQAAEQLLAAKASSSEALAALEERVRKRSLHKNWTHHGLDGMTALRSLILLRAPSAVETARFALWRDDPALEPVVDRRWKNPRAWTDFRVKMVIFPALAKCPGEATEKLCRDYLALSNEDARQLGPPDLFEQAAKALLAVSPRTETALELMKHRLQAVRGRSILYCLAHGHEPWALAALEQGAPHALVYRTDG